MAFVAHLGTLVFVVVDALFEALIRFYSDSVWESVQEIEEAKISGFGVVVN